MSDLFLDEANDIEERHLLIKINRRKILSAAWRSSSLYAAGSKIHDFAPPPHDGFAFSR